MTRSMAREKRSRGPSLVGANLKHGQEDWQLYQTIRQGIPGTRMPPFELSQDQIWELVSYLQTLNPSGEEEVVAGDLIAYLKTLRLRCHRLNNPIGVANTEST